MDRKSWSGTVLVARGCRFLCSGTLFRSACFGLAFLGASHLCCASTIASMNIIGSLSTCGVDSPPLNESSRVYVSDGLGPIEMTCDDGANDTASMAATAKANPDTPPLIAVVASSTGTGAFASARATFDDFLTITPPFGLTALDAPLRITAPYLLTLSEPGGSNGAALVQLTVDIYAFREAHLTDPGAASGTLDTGEITIPNCPCVIEILGTVAVQGQNGAGGTARDPFMIELPEGWTYTLASEQQAQAGAVPEPGSLVLVGSILLAAGMERFRRTRRTKSLAPAISG